MNRILLILMIFVVFNPSFAKNHKSDVLGYGNLRQVIYSPEGTKVASCGSGGIFIWDVLKKEVILSIQENIGTVICIDFSPDGSKIASGSKDGYIRIWNSNNGKLINILSGFNPDYNIKFSSDSRRIESFSEKSIKIWDISTGISIDSLADNYFNPLCFSFCALSASR